MEQVQFSKLLEREATVSGEIYGITRKFTAIHKDDRFPLQRQVALIEQFKFLISAEVTGKVNESDSFCHH